MKKLLTTITITMFLAGCERGGGGPPVGVLTPDRCRNLAAESYADALAEALADPTVWEFDGRRSAQDYAEARRNLMLLVCGG